MKFTRVDNETVNCLITQEDLDEQGIELQDFFDRKQEAMDFIKEVLERAAEEVDYHPGGAYLPMQITVLPDRSLSITISENPNSAISDLVKTLVDQSGVKLTDISIDQAGSSDKEEGKDDRSSSGGNIDQLTGYLQGLKHFATALRQYLEDSSKKGSEENTGSAQHTDNGSLPAIEGDDDKLRFSACVFEFGDMHSVIALCSQIPGDIQMESRLYKGGENNDYFMVIRRNNEKAKIFASIFARAYEFGKYVTTNEYVITALDENMELIIGEDAIGKLRGLGQ